MNAATERPSPGVAEPTEGSPGKPRLSQTASELMPDDGVDACAETTSSLLSAGHAVVRALVRLIQCSICSKPFNLPVTLPCGKSICRTCLPQSRERNRITWPDLPDRRKAITCPIRSCGAEHTVADCCVDVALSKVMESIAEVVVRTRSLFDTSNSVDIIPGDTRPTPVATAKGGPLLEMYNAAILGELPYDQDMQLGQRPDPQRDQAVDKAILDELMETCNKELDCQVCYNLMLDPVTTYCGHTLCRKCLVRTLDHSHHCPVCRRMVLIPPSLQSHPSNQTISDLLLAVCPDLIAAREAAVTAEEAAMRTEYDTPLFVVTLGFPSCPTFLRVFEPRYRLMLRRAIESDQTFGIVMYNPTGAAQGELGRSHFLQYGTLLRIVNAQTMSDGTSVVETRGISRFKVVASSTLDGYAVGRVERVEDIPLAEEEAIEAADVATPPVIDGNVDVQLARMSTHELLALGLDFIRKTQERSAPWLHEGILHAYGGPPDDAAIFPYWFASILPINDGAKYQLLRTRSVRQRLKITARWIKAMEQQRWWNSNNACTVL